MASSTPHRVSSSHGPTPLRNSEMCAERSPGAAVHQGSRLVIAGHLNRALHPERDATATPAATASTRSDESAAPRVGPSLRRLPRCSLRCSSPRAEPEGHGREVRSPRSRRRTVPGSRDARSPSAHSPKRWGSTHAPVFSLSPREAPARSLLDARSGRVLWRVPIPGHARHLGLAGPGDPLLIPSEPTDRLLELDLRSRHLTHVMGAHPTTPHRRPAGSS